MAAIQSYMSPGLCGASSMPTAKSNDFFKVFGNTVTSSQTIEPQDTEKTNVGGANPGTSSADEPSLFDFDPSHTADSPYQHQFSTPGASGVPWANDLNFRPLSPPTSATFSPKDWSFDFEEQQNPANILTDLDPVTTRMEYGQVTPPDDEIDKEDPFGYQIPKDRRLQLQSQQTDSSLKKRKRSNLSNGEPGTQPTKRSRKYASRSANPTDEDDKPEDVKRSKFLERNRVAASKCRQKKKEWTHNLETRARELQKNNNIMRMDIESLRQEVLFLKGEMLKHNSCHCREIQEFVKLGVNPFIDTSDDDTVVKRETSPFDEEVLRGLTSGPSSRESESVSPAPHSSNTAIVNDERVLKALLSDSIHHNTSNEGIASKLAAC